MAGQSILETLSKKFGDRIVAVNLEAIDPWVEVAPDALPDVCQFLKSDANTQFDMLNCITVVDYFEPDPKKAAKAGFDPHLELVYHLSSITKKHTLVVKVTLPRWQNDEAGNPPRVPTVSHLWRTADWHERETFDLSGVHFVGHPDLRRILCPEDWVGFPLRKDYEMPLEYHGIRGR